MTDVKALRETLAEVDRQRAIERSAESARCSIRLGATPVSSRGRLVFWKRADIWNDHAFSRDETNAIYEALAIVRENARKRAAELEQQIEGGAA